MKALQTLTLLFALAYLLPSYTQGQAKEPTAQDSVTYVIETRDGNSYEGVIVNSGAGYIILATQNIGTITIQFEDIEMLRRKGESTSTNYLEINPQQTRYLFAPTGYGLRKGEIYYQNVWLFINQFSLGITDYFSLGVGLVPIFIAGADGFPVWITPKVSFPVVKEKLHLSVGSLNGTVLGWDEHFGVFYSNLTVGSRQNNFSVGLGKAYQAYESLESNDWVEGVTINISGTVKVGKRASLMTENYITPSDVSYISVGGRHMVTRLSIDYGLVALFDEYSGGALPWLGITIPLSKKYSEK